MPRRAVRAARRVPGLDVLRGIAIIGTLASNIWLFTAFAGQRIIDPWWADVLRWSTNGMFLGLLTIMFGVGLEIQRQAAIRGGRRWPGTYPVRAALLFVDGMLNYILVVQFDVLRSYAIVGFLIAFVILLPERWQWVFIAVAVTTHVTLLVFAQQEAQRFAVMPPREPTADELASAAVSAPTGPPTYWDTVVDAASSVFSSLSIESDAGTIIILGLSVFTLGAMIYRKGVFEPRGANLRKLLMFLGFGVGLPADVILFATGNDILFGRYLAATVTAFGILGLVAQFYSTREPGFVGRQLANVGRMALSCYVLQNILGRYLQNVISNSPLSSALDPIIGTILMFATISTLLVLFAATWMRIFHRGPLEYLWNWCFTLLTRGRLPAPAYSKGRP